MQATAEQVLEAIKSNNIAALRAVLQSHPGAVNEPLSGGISPLMMARYYQRKEMLDLLLASGAQLDIFSASALGLIERIHTYAHHKPASVNAYSVDGWTPLALAAFFGQRQAVWTLLTHDADVHAVSRSPQQNTALHAAVAGLMNRHGNELPISYLLIARGAPVNARDSGGDTPLHIAAGSGSQALILGLLGAGADISARDSAGRTPLGIALSRDQQGAADLLRQMGAQE